MVKQMLLLSLAFLFMKESQGQTPKPATNTPIRFTTKFGAFADSSKAFATDLKLITNLDLKVTDQTGTTWTIVKYRFGWRRKEVSDDYKTGQRKTILTFYAHDVDGSSKIPVNWQNEMKESLQPGEEIMFESIIVQHPTTKKMMMAPSLHLFVR